MLYFKLGYYNADVFPFSSLQTVIILFPVEPSVVILHPMPDTPAATSCQPQPLISNQPNNVASPPSLALAQSPLRRSTRITQLPNYLNQYYCNSATAN